MSRLFDKTLLSTSPLRRLVLAAALAFGATP